jgi:hypothetical protein
LTPASSWIVPPESDRFRIVDCCVVSVRCKVPPVMLSPAPETSTPPTMFEPTDIVTTPALEGMQA